MITHYTTRIFVGERIEVKIDYYVDQTKDDDGMVVYYVVLNYSVQNAL